MKRTKILLVLGVLLISTTLVSATLLSFYGEVRTTANVKQSIVFDGKEDNTAITREINTVGGNSKCFKEQIKNRAEIDGNVDLVTTYNDPVGVTTTIYQSPNTVTLQMNNKDANWIEIDDDGMSGTLTFAPIGTTFDYTFSATGLKASTDYCLIYYADPWAGNHPGAYIATITTDGSGNIVGSTGSVNLGINIPSSPDPNYVSHTGGKIWLVTAIDYDISTHSMKAWNMQDYLFEHNLVVYTDCNLPIDCWMAPLLGTPITGTLTVPAESHIHLIFCYQFAINIEGGQYIISTKAVPVI